MSTASNERSDGCAGCNGTNAAEPADDVCLYRKQKDVSVYLTEKKQLCAEARMLDSRHRMTCRVTFSQPDLIIEDVQGRMERYPHADCLKALSSLEVMIGKPVRPGVLQAAAKSIKGGACTHLLDLFHEACYSVIQGHGLFRRQILEQLHPDLNSEQIAKVVFTLMPALLNSCVSYQNETDFVKMLEKTPFPLDPEQLLTFQSICRSHQRSGGGWVAGKRR